MEVNKKMPIIQRGLQIGMESWHCGRCLSYCPAGQWKEKFLDKELSGGLIKDALYKG